MSIDIYYYSSPSNLKAEDFIKTFDEVSFTHLSECNELYEKRTGKFIDEYGDLRLPKGTITPLHNCVSEIFEREKDHKKLSTLKIFREILISAIEQERGLCFYGD